MKLTDTVRAEFLEKVSKFLEEQGDEVLLTKSNTIALPWAKEEEEGYITITFSIPKGDRSGEPYNGHLESQSYQMKLKEDAEKKRQKEDEKKKKIQRDAEYRKRKAEQKMEMGK